MNSPNSTLSQSRKQNSDLLPNEQKVSYDELQLFFEKHKFGIVASILILLIAIAGLIGWNYQQSNLENQAHERLAAAKTPEALKAVIQDFPHSNTALLAEFEIANQAYAQGKWDEALAVYKKMMEYDPSLPLVPSAIIGQGAVYEAIGKREEALKSYQSMDQVAPKSFQAPEAKFAAARLLQTEGKLKESQKCYEDLISDFPKSAWRTEAEAQLKKLNLQLRSHSPVAAEKTASTPTTSPASLATPKNK